MLSRQLASVLIGAGLSTLVALMVIFVEGDAGPAGPPGRAVPPVATTSVPPPIPSPNSAPLTSPATVPAPTKPVIGSDFPDPDILKVGDVYYAYSTNSGGKELPIATAPALTGPWTKQSGDGLPDLPSWASDGRTWAPEVVARQDGTYALYYTARRSGTDKQCIGVATSVSPGGPFKPVGDAPLICPLNLGGAIDAAAFTDSDGARYLLYKCRGYDARKPATIFIQRLTPDGLARLGPPRSLLTRDKREPSLIEAPALVQRGGKYVLFYSAGSYYKSEYETWYAVASSVNGPYTKMSGPLLSTERYGERVRGPGGGDVFSEGGADYLIFHGILKSGGGKDVTRGMFAASLGWDGARPVVHGSPVRLEAENGRTSNCGTALSRRKASGGKALAAVEGDGCRLDLDVFVPVTATYDVRVRYANRSGIDGYQELTANSLTPTAVTLARTSRSQWRTTTVSIPLKAGWNILSLRRVSGMGEVDYLEVLEAQG
ncbi:family 43 glycosylhydrolase [Actinomadura fulvescens]|uniref:CBM6 domain-containing protein n=1 Tax=Actinomadura fulvescens TaxID=46160 RepID=A0ABN3Q4M8_9ACTN